MRRFCQVGERMVDGFGFFLIPVRIRRIRPSFLGFFGGFAGESVRWRSWCLT